MGKILFLSGPAYGHVTPLLELAKELANRKNEVYFFCTKEFRKPIEDIGAYFLDLKYEDIKPKLGKGVGINNILFDIAIRTFISYDKTIEDILLQIQNLKLDYIIFDSMFAVGKMIADILNIPAISSLAVFATKDELNSTGSGMEIIPNHPQMELYLNIKKKFNKFYGIEVPELSELLYNYGEFNIVYTCKYLLEDPNIYNNRFHFCGGPQYTIKKSISFPWDKIKGKEIIYISLGTAFNAMYKKLYHILFDAFRDREIIVVMATFRMEMSEYDIPDNYIVCDYVPQKEILKYTKVAITHGGLNTTSDLIYAEIPFLTLPISGDQPFMARCLERKGATIILNKDELSKDYINTKLHQLLSEKKYLHNIKKLKEEFLATGGVRKAVDKIQEYVKSNKK